MRRDGNMQEEIAAQITGMERVERMLKEVRTKVRMTMRDEGVVRFGVG